MPSYAITARPSDYAHALLLDVVHQIHFHGVNARIRLKNSQSRQVKSWFLQRTLSEKKLECGAMPNVMADMPNISGALCSTPQSLADAQYWSAVQ